ncbi:hypothetical protein AMECASPLE_009986 [Ameca splendens]|uniref:Uncharacterized protein n=1 Tax=Ameca splendens TaxID=208324 RepID=A0ABV0Z978_9TELE
MHAQGEHANSKQKDPRLGIEPRTFLLQGNSATNCATMQPTLICFRVTCYALTSLDTAPRLKSDLVGLLATLRQLNKCTNLRRDGSELLKSCSSIVVQKREVYKSSDGENRGR